jgi:hypothetical protein
MHPDFVHDFGGMDFCVSFHYGVSIAANMNPGTTAG